MRRFLAPLARPQNRTTLFLLLNNATGAATGLLFWVVLARFAGLGPEDIGIGYVVVALGTTVGLVAKGGLDTALLRHAPDGDHRDARRLLVFAVMVGAAVAALISLVLAGMAGHGVPELGMAWWLVGGIAALLVVAWLQDAYFLAEGDPAATFRRNLVFSGGRLVLPLPVLALALPYAVPLTWALALVASAVAGMLLARRQPVRPGGRADGRVPRRMYLQSAARNITGNAAEFLPGLILTPLVLVTAGAAAAGHFGMAWTAAALLFLASAAIGRSALAAMARGVEPRGPVMRRSLRQSLIVVPGALGGILLAPWIMSIFGPGYVAAAPAFRILCASTLFIVPAYLYLAVLRAGERGRALTLFPAAMVALILVLAFVLGDAYGMDGVAIAWLAANAPFGLFAAWRLARITQEVPHATFGRHPDAE